MPSRGKSRKQLVKDLDTVFSRYIRLKNSKEGDSTCVTCGDTKPWKEMQAGHFFTRGRYPTRWDEDNVHVQCARCNVFLKGNYIRYTFYMINKYSDVFVSNLEARSLSSVKMSTPELKEKIDYYKEEVEKLL